MVFKKGMALSPLHSRQLIVHGHVAIGERVITVPGYEVGGADEGAIRLVGREGKGEAPSPAEPVAAEQAPAEQAAEAR